LVFGDSNAIRCGHGNKAWPRLIEEKDPLHLTIINESYDGRTTRYDVGERNGLMVINSKLVTHAPLDYVVVMLGTNDVKNKYGPPSPSEITEGMSRILDIIENYGSGVKPFLLTPPPLSNVTSGELAGARLRVPPVAAGYRSLARNLDIPVIDIHSIIDLATDLEPDMVHLNAAGKKKVANAVWANFLGESLHDKQAEV
jgi:lysophospholipase L1-like esterase